MTRKPHGIPRTALFVLAALLSASTSFADGVLRPSNAAYPADFLRHKLTKIDVAFHGQIAVTTVYQEFVNEWTSNTDAVYAFPLAREARATDFLFWAHDTVFRAPLRIREQAPNPGSGEGGIDAALTRYLGSNALRVLIKNIPAGKIQQIQVQFISLCRYDRGRLIYTYPLETSEFTNYPVDGLSVTLTAENSDEIKSLDLQGWSGAAVHWADSRHVTASFDRSKTYLTSDLVVSMATAPDTLSVDMQATNIDTLGGHFVLFVKPQRTLDTARILPRNVVFLLDRTVYTTAENLQAAVQAVKTCLGMLRPGDRFNIRTLTYSDDAWRPGLVPVTPGAVDSARSFLDQIGAYISGSYPLQHALISALAGFPSDGSSAVLVVFADGRAVVDPRQVAAANGGKAAVFPVGVGTTVRWHALEMLAYLNGGIPTVISSADQVAAETDWLFGQINDPIFRNVRLEMGSDAFDIFPQLPQALYGGSRFYLTGRFHNPGPVSMALAGIAADGPYEFGYLGSFPGVTNERAYVASLWAKERLDELERQIDVYGATDSLKNLAVNTSLKYGIRCMYTAYIADKTNPVSGVRETGALLASAEACRTGEGVLLRWSFASGGSVRAVYVCRSKNVNGPFVRLSDDPVPGCSFLDRTPPAGAAWYQLEILLADGERLLSPPVPGDRSAAPPAFALMQNYPNPFNPSTTIPYAVAGEHPAVTLAVFDALGREIRTLVSGYQPAGTYQAVWDGRDGRGAQVAAGVYYCRLRAGSFSRTRMMLLVK